MADKVVQGQTDVWASGRQRVFQDRIMSGLVANTEYCRDKQRSGKAEDDRITQRQAS